MKSTNPAMSVCEIGATIGRMWRELSDEEKQRHMEDFNEDKVGRRLSRIALTSSVRFKFLFAIVIIQLICNDLTKLFLKL